MVEADGGGDSDGNGTTAGVARFDDAAPPSAAPPSAAPPSIAPLSAQPPAAPVVGFHGFGDSGDTPARVATFGDLDSESDREVQVARLTDFGGGTVPVPLTAIVGDLAAEVDRRRAVVDVDRAAVGGRRAASPRGRVEESAQPELTTPDARATGRPEPGSPPTGAPRGGVRPAATRTTGGRPASRDRRASVGTRASSSAELDPDADPVAAARDICLRLLTDRSRARRAIAMELRRKGVDDEVAGEALAEVDDESEERRARELVVRKLRSLALDTTEQRAAAARRLVGMLARKGYGGSIAYRVVREELARQGADVEELDVEPEG